MKQSKTCVLLLTVDRVDKKLCEGRGRQYHFEALQIPADVNLDSKPLMVLETVGEIIAAADEGRHG